MARENKKQTKLGERDDAVMCLAGADWSTAENGRRWSSPAIRRFSRSTLVLCMLPAPESKDWRSKTIRFISLSHLKVVPWLQLRWTFSLLSTTLQDHLSRPSWLRPHVPGWDLPLSSQTPHERV